MSKKIKAIILDWAGTTVDFGSNAPVAAFVKAFEVFGVTPTVEETREPMGMQKRAHIEKMLNGERLSALWEEAQGRPHTKEDIDKIYAEFEPALMASLTDYTTPITGVLETVEKIRDMGIKIGSTTGYTGEMMDVVVPSALEKGYGPDCVVVPDQVNGIGRPYPYMLWRNLQNLSVSSIDQVIKIGDTSADMAEGKNAGCITVGVIKGSNMMGISEDEFNALSTDQITEHYKDVRKKYESAGADYVIDDITVLPELINHINTERGE